MNRCLKMDESNDLVYSYILVVPETGSIRRSLRYRKVSRQFSAVLTDTLAPWADADADANRSSFPCTTQRN